jgi:hypothetical protein
VFGRLDFVSFVIGNPDATGLCPATDRVAITSPGSGNGFNANPPVLCGTLTGSHSKHLLVQLIHLLIHKLINCSID